MGQDTTPKSNLAGAILMLYLNLLSHNILLLPTFVRRSSWKLSSCVEYIASDNEIESDESESEEGKQEVSGSESE